MLAISDTRCHAQSMTSLLELLRQYEIVDFEVTDEHYGNGSKGPLKKLIVYNHFIFDTTEFNRLGYGVICRLK